MEKQPRIVWAWSGYAFEQICLSYIHQIKNALGIGSVQTQSSSWLGSNGAEKAQIDLVIDRREANAYSQGLVQNSLTMDALFPTDTTR